MFLPIRMEGKNIACLWWGVRWNGLEEEEEEGGREGGREGRCWRCWIGS